MKRNEVDRKKLSPMMLHYIELKDNYPDTIIFYRSIKIALKQNNLFYKYVTFGLSFGILLQVILNILVVTGTIPTTGITLPFLSYGGSSLLISMISIGIILNISRNPDWITNECLL